jgi:hypothetical protein
MNLAGMRRIIQSFGYKFDGILKGADGLFETYEHPVTCSTVFLHLDGTWMVNFCRPSIHDPYAIEYYEQIRWDHSLKHSLKDACRAGAPIKEENKWPIKGDHS